MWGLRVMLVGFGLFISPAQGSKYKEPMCTSRFDFEDKLLHKLVRLEHAMELLQEKVNQQLADIKVEGTEMKEELSAFKQDLQADQTEALNTMKSVRVDIEADRARLSDEIQKMGEENEAKLGRMSGDIVDALNKSASSKFAFSVQHARAALVDGAPTFSTIHVNHGDAYDKHTGKFTAKEGGVYVFTFNIRALSSNQVYCYIMKNGSTVNYASVSGGSDTTSVTVYVDMTSGDYVNLGSCGNWNGAYIQFSHTSFMGFKI